MATTRIWPGSSSFFPGDTPYGTYDNDSQFQSDTEKTAVWCARRIGYPIVDIELQDKQFFACFEEAVTEYSSQVNRFNIKENLLSLRGNSTSSNFTHKHFNPSLNDIVGISKAYGTEAGVGGDVNLYSGSIAVVKNQQVYDLTNSNDTTYESGTPGTDAIEVRRVFYESTPAMTRFFDPHIGSGLGSQQLLSSFGWGNYSPAINYLLMPMYDDLLRVQAIEFNDLIRKSAYSFHIQNNKLRVFPAPDANYTMYFHYIKVNDRKNFVVTNDVSDFSNVGYDNMSYSTINDPGKQWIKKYTLALVKELLGSIRGKYGSMPIPNGDVTLDGDTLRTEGAAERDALISELREDLEAASRRNMMERQNDIANFQQETMNKMPYGIYIG
tara:strand:- start:5632 stop:6780 length:1149 start_codon:yes stop_codon:yes gene_type:complete